MTLHAANPPSPSPWPGRRDNAFHLLSRLHDLFDNGRQGPTTDIYEAHTPSSSHPGRDRCVGVAAMVGGDDYTHTPVDRSKRVGNSVNWELGFLQGD